MIPLCGVAGAGKPSLAKQLETNGAVCMYQPLFTRPSYSAFGE
jgi:hypothetical protein